ncbi:MAG: DUF3037 domain-containing protein [Pirellulales bacterium]|nr:DUF3037 domain-containing protein [Pirellulales bacterium]
MQPTKGYYSLIQYCPDAGRVEAANIGVLLFCPELGFLEAKTVRNNRRIIRFFGVEGHDWSRINTMKHGLEERLKVESNGIYSLDDLERFIALRANLLQITPPRSMRVTDPKKDLESLFTEVIGETAKLASTKSLRKVLQDRIKDAGLEEKVISDFEVQSPFTKKAIEVPIGYQNGRFNLVKPVPFEAENSQLAYNTACRYAVEGQSLYEHRDPTRGDLQLVVVGKFRSKDRESPLLVRKVLEEHKVRLYQFSALPELVAEIRRTAKKISNKPNW